ncbi:unnamed protein product [Ascophyllum nodosum]
MTSRFKRQRETKASNPKPIAPTFDDEDDYLSAAFVMEKPNPPRGKRAKEEDPERGRVLSKKAIAQKMEERREEGLQQKIGKDNAGFKLLMKLGYKGGGLGKDGGGASNPIVPQLKQDRLGLGRVSETKRKKEEQKERAKKKAERDARREVERRENFRLSKAAQFVDRRLREDLGKVRRLVESLDEAEGRPRSVMWPDEASLEDEGESLNEVVESSEGKAGLRFGDLLRAGGDWSGSGATECSGDEGERITTAQGGGGLANGGARDEWERMASEEQLSACLAYLRESYFYCMYCACKYCGQEDMRESCPGPDREDHDD